MGEALVLEVEHEVDLALAVELDLLGAVAVAAAKAQAMQHRATGRGLAALIHELDELDAFDARQRCRRRHRADLLLEPEEGAHAVLGDPAGRRGAEVVAEDLVAEPAAVADLGQLLQHRRHRQVALAGKAPVVPAQEQKVHLDAGRVRGLDEDDALGRDGADGVDRQAPGEQVEAVEDQAHLRMVGRAHRGPGLPVVVDVAAPGQRLEADLDAELARELAQLVQIGRDAGRVVDRFRGHAAADQEQRRAQSLHQLELAPRPLEGASAQRFGQALEVAKRLQRHDLEPERARERPHVLRPAVEIGQIVLEDLDAVETRFRSGAELVGKGSRHADRGDRSLHDHVSRGRSHRRRRPRSPIR